MSQHAFGRTYFEEIDREKAQDNASAQGLVAMALSIELYETLFTVDTDGNNVSLTYKDTTYENVGTLAKGIPERVQELMDKLDVNLSLETIKSMKVGQWVAENTELIFTLIGDNNQQAN